MQISAGEVHLVMLDNDSSVWSVGYNGYGTIGIGNTGDQVYAQQMKTSDGKEILYGVKEVAARKT